MAFESKSLNRRHFLRLTTQSAGLITVVQASSPLGTCLTKNFAEMEPRFTLALPQGRVLPQMMTALIQFRERLLAVSAGALNVTLRPQPEENRRIFPRVATGEFDLALRSVSKRTDAFRSSLFFGGVPQAIASPLDSTWIHSQEAEALWAELYRPLGVVPVFFLPKPGVAGQFARRPIARLADLKGLRVAVLAHDPAQRWYRQNGMEPLIIEDLAQVGALLKSKKIDLSPMLSHAKAKTLGLGGEGLHYLINDWQPAGCSFALAFNGKRWKGLRAESQKLIRESARAAGQGVGDHLAMVRARALAEIREGSTVGAFGSEIKVSYRDFLLKNLAAVASKRPLFRKIAQSYFKGGVGLT